MVKMRKFIQFLDGLPNKLTSGQLETACLFIQTHLNKELAANDKPVINGAVKADPIIKEVLGKYKRSKAERALKEGEDFQSKIATRITKEQMYKLTEQDPAGASRFKTFWSYRVPIYNLITHLMETGLSEPEALEQAQPVFDSVLKDWKARHEKASKYIQYETKGDWWI